MVNNLSKHSFCSLKIHIERMNGKAVGVVVISYWCYVTAVLGESIFLQISSKFVRQTCVIAIGSLIFDTYSKCHFYYRCGILIKN